MSHCLELVIYHIKPELITTYQEHDLPKFRSLVKSQTGFISYKTYLNCEQQNIHLDLVTWNNLENATAAAAHIKKLQQSTKYQNYLNAFEKVSMFQHFTPL